MKTTQHIITLSALAFVLGGTLPDTVAAGDKAPENYPADNSGRNIRDAYGTTLTPQDQSGSESDRKLTQRIRQAIMDDKDLSLNAQNVKIVAVGGKVTLRGPVKSPGEKLNVVSKARQIAGLENVTDELEIAP